MRIAHPDQRDIARAGGQGKCEAPGANFGGAHIHLEGEAKAVMLQETQMFYTCASEDAQMIARGDAPMDDECGGAPGAVARDFGHAAVGVEQPDFGISIAGGHGEVKPAIGADAGVAVANGARQLGGRNSRRQVGNHRQKKIILRAVCFEKRNPHEMGNRDWRAQCFARIFR